MTDLLVIGLGYVGVVLANAAANAGLQVTGFDANVAVISALRDEKFKVIANEAELPSCRTIVVCVSAILTDDQSVDIRPITRAATTVGRLLKPGTLVILESTCTPGTTEELFRPILEKSSHLRAGRDFHLAYSPERIDPGNLRFTLTNIPKIIGGYTTRCAQRAAEFYRQLCRTVIVAKSSREAEMAKLVENIYRQVNIALVNELAIVSHELNVDIWNAIECASTKPFGYQPFYPSVGAAGACIPNADSYLTHPQQVGPGTLRLGSIAREVNLQMPEYVADRVIELVGRERSISGAKILFLGITYKPNCAQYTSSAAQKLARILLARGADICYHDPHIRNWTVSGYSVRRAADLPAEIRTADLTLLLQRHATYNLQEIAADAQLLFDLTGQVTAPNIAKL